MPSFQDGIFFALIVLIVLLSKQKKFCRVYKYLIVGKCMSVIKRLSPEVASKIAAGEVVERPFNVVKELIENSCDAGADKITVEIVDGGLSRIKVTDNGKGISREDLPLALERFATSKAESVEDVYSASTFGFRGEALAAVSAVSDFSIKSCQDVKGYEISSKYGVVSEVKPAAAVKGTVIEAARLFENLPARRKFLKSSRSLEGEIVKLIKHFSLINPHIEISLISDGKVLYHALLSEDVTIRAAKVFTGKAFYKGEVEYGSTKVYAAATLPSASDRLKKDAIIIGVNGRLIKDASLIQAAISAYYRLIPDNRYPCAVVDIRIDPSEVDANVHPAKLEVRFENARDIFSLVSDAVSNCFKGKGVNVSYDNVAGKTSEKDYSFEETIKSNSADNNGSVFVKDNFNHSSAVQEKHNFISCFNNAGRSENINYEKHNTITNQPEIKDINTTNTEKISYSTDIYTEIDKANYVMPEKEQVQNQESIEDRILSGKFRVVGQIDKTYIVIETENKEIVYIDQHAAHERILFEKIQSENNAKPKPSVVLHEPLTAVLTDEIVENIDSYKAVIESFGYGYNISGIDKVDIIRIPYSSVRKNIEKEFRLIVSDLCIYGKSKNEDAPRAILSCKSAIKAGDELRTEEMEYLVKLLFNTENFGTCPHGRPIIYVMSVAELSRKFYR